MFFEDLIKYILSLKNCNAVKNEIKITKKECIVVFINYSI